MGNVIYYQSGNVSYSIFVIWQLFGIPYFERIEKKYGVPVMKLSLIDMKILCALCTQVDYCRSRFSNGW